MNKTRTIVALVAAGAAILTAWSGTEGRVQPWALRARLAERAHEASTRGRESLRQRFREEKEQASRAPSGKGEARGYRESYDTWFLRQRAYPAGAVPANALGKAFAHATSHNNDDDDPFEGSFWKPLGPSSIPDGQTDDTKSPVLSPVSGRVSAIAVHPWNPDIVYVGGAQGGVWVTYNARSSKPHWFPLTDREASLAVGSIAIDPKDPSIIYVGTGEPSFSCDSYYGRGVLRSTNGGFSWKLLGGGGELWDNTGPFVGKSVSKIIIDPSTAGSKSKTTLWASTFVGLYTSGTSADCNFVSLAPRGVWRSRDSGTTWEQVFSGFVNDMALDPTNHEVLYVGQYASGVYKSTNAFSGAPTNFTKLTGLPAGTGTSPLGRVALSIGGPAANGMLYAAIANDASSGLWGFFKTADAGATWANVDDGFRGGATVQNFDFGPGFGTLGVVFRGSGPDFVTDGSWSRRRIHLGAESRTIFFVDDADTLFLTAAFPGIGAPTDLPYSVANYPNYCDGQCWYDMTVAVDPTDPSAGRVYVGGNPHSFSPNAAANLAEPVCDASAGACPSHYNWRTDNGGHTWSSISQGDGVKGGLHTDDHAIAFDGWGAVYDGNDGGIWRSRDRGTSWTSMNTNLAITQFQGVSTHPKTKRIVLGGTQDNGTNLLNASLVAPPKWFHTDFGDGGQSLIDHSTPATMYHTYFNQSFNFMGPAKSTDGGVGGPGSWPFVGSYYYPGYYNGMDPTDPVSFYAPLAQHPAFTPNVVYFGSDKVYRSVDPRPPCCDGAASFECIATGTLVCTNDDSWVKVSPSLTALPGFYVSWIGVFPKLIDGKEVLYTGSADGRIAASKDVDGTGVATWNFIDAPPLPGRAVASIEVPGSDPTGNTAYACFSGFDDATPGVPGHVFKTTSGLSPTPTWEDISGDLPDLPCNRIIVDPSTQPASLYVGSDIGVFRSRDGGEHWKLLSKGLPHVAVFGLERNPKTGQIVASTHGRGMFQLVRTRDDWDGDAREAKAWFDHKRRYERR